MSGAETIADWTTGQPALVYQGCGACSAIWYFRRGFCPACGTPSPRDRRASGKGAVHAATLVCRAATPETKALVPYAILLIDAAEGFRLMAHGDPDLVIGDTVTLAFRDFAGRLAPYATRAP
jgi:uncharacterized OB-fold protein